MPARHLARCAHRPAAAAATLTLSAAAAANIPLTRFRSAALAARRLAAAVPHAAPLRRLLQPPCLPVLACRTNRPHATAAASMATVTLGPSGLLTTKTFFLDNFALRQWDDPAYGGTRLACDKAGFIARIQAAHDAGAPLVDGYAPFCKHVFVPNFTGALVGALEITDANRHLLRSGYTKRRPEELAVLTRWFQQSDVEVPVAKHLDIILYSREQLVKEYEAMPTKGASAELPDAPWGIISVKAQDEPFETPMQPITMLRNALGREEGGSGVPLNRAEYEKSVQYWESHATIVDGPKPNGE